MNVHNRSHDHRYRHQAGLPPLQTDVRFCRIADVAVLHRYAPTCIYGWPHDSQRSLLIRTGVAHIVESVAHELSAASTARTLATIVRTLEVGS